MESMLHAARHTQNPMQSAGLTDKQKACRPVYRQKFVFFSDSLPGRRVDTTHKKVN